MKPFSQSGRSIRSSTIRLTVSSGTSPPDCMTPAISFPISSPAAKCSRSMSPVEMWATPRDCRRSLAWVPFPEPGGPNIMRHSLERGGAIGWARGLSDTASPPPYPARPRRKSFIVAHDQLRLDLVDGVHGHAHHNQQRGAAEVKVYSQTVQQPAREISVDEVAHQRHALQRDTADHDLRNQRQDGQVQATHH